jgi:uroporphyrinogen-III synthase
LPAFSVGAASARAAAEAGFTRVESAGGDVDDLGALVTRCLNPAAGALLHVAGSRRAGDLAGALGARGFEVRRAVLYEAVTVTALPSDAAAALAERRLDAVLLFSPRTAATFARLISTAGLAPACRDLTAFCLSQAVAAKLTEMDWRRIAVARRPEQEHLLALLREEAKA